MTTSIGSVENASRDTRGIDGEQQPASQRSASEPTALQASASMVSLLSPTANDRCSVCSAELAADQRYCVECGARRGKARFVPLAPRPAAASTATLPSSARQRFGGNTMIALVIVMIVLLALGVGALIGDSGTQTVRVVLKSGVASSTTSGKGSSGSTGKSTAPKTGKSTTNFFNN